VRPPGEHLLVVRIQRATGVDEACGEKLVKQRTLFGALADDLRLSVALVQIDIAVSNIEIAGQDQCFAAGNMRLGPRDHVLVECNLCVVVLAAIGRIDARVVHVCHLGHQHPGLHVELRHIETRRRKFLTNVQTHAGVPALGTVPVGHVAGQAAGVRFDLFGRGLDLLQAKYVRFLGVRPERNFFAARADPVHIEGCDFHGRDHTALGSGVLAKNLW
jgi:hypothetical protein